MADYGALHDAEALFAEAQGLMARLEREIALTADACADAEGDLARLERLASEAVDHVAWLGVALDEGRHRQGALEEGLRILATASGQLGGLRVTACLEPPRLDAFARPDGAIRAEVALALARNLDEEALRRCKLRPQQLDTERWDLMAEDFASFEESYSTALDWLGEAKTLADHAARQRPEDRASRRVRAGSESKTQKPTPAKG